MQFGHVSSKLDGLNFPRNLQWWSSGSHHTASEKKHETNNQIRVWTSPPFQLFFGTFLGFCEPFSSKSISKAFQIQGKWHETMVFAVSSYKSGRPVLGYRLDRLYIWSPHSNQELKLCELTYQIYHEIAIACCHFLGVTAPDMVAISYASQGTWRYREKPGAIPEEPTVC